MSISKIIIIAFVLFDLIIAVPTYAGSNSGTAAAQFLKIGVGARATALAGAATALVDDPSALYWNVAAISQIPEIALFAAHARWFADIRHDFAGVTFPIADKNSVGFSLTALTMDEIEQTTLEDQDGTGIFYDVSDVAIAFSAARQFTERFSIGFSGKYIRQNVWNESASTFAIDIGAMLITDFRGARLGMQFSNLGGDLKLDGSDLLQSDGSKLVTESYSLPTRFQLGLALDLIGKVYTSQKNRLTVAIDGAHPGDGDETLHFGLEYARNEWLFLRSGYVANHESADFSFGGGLRFDLAKTKIQLDYAYADLGLLEDVQRLSLGFQF